MSARYAAAQRIVQNSQHEEVEGVILDLFTASAMVAVYQALSPSAQALFDDIPFEKLAAFCLSKVSRA
jgi:hypothetical protein